MVVLLWLMLQPYARDVELTVSTLGVVVLLIRALSMAGFALVAFFSSAIAPILSGLLNGEMPSAQRATIISIQQLLWCFFIAVVEPMVRALADRVGVPGAVGATGMLSAVCLVPLLALSRRAAGRAEVAGPLVVALR